MKRLIFLLIPLFTWLLSASAQEPGLPPEEFDAMRSGIAHGHIDTITYDSKTVGTKRKAVVYLPRGYTEKNKYPVLYLLHGIGGDELEWLRNGQPQHILDNLYAEKKIAPMIVVLPNGRAMADDRATGNMDKFAWIGGFSSAPNTRQPEALIPDVNAARKNIRLLWVSCGTEDNLLPISERTVAYLIKNDIRHVYYKAPGKHDFQVWKKDLYNFSQLLFNTK